MRLSFFVVFTLAVCYGASIENHQAREPIVWQDEFEFLDINKWKHLITAWRGGNSEFQYYDNNLPENR
jgi:hypothetical protein